MRLPLRTIVLLGLAAVASCLTGCGPSVWARSFAWEPGVVGTPIAPVEPGDVVVRDAPWGRVGPALDAERDRLVVSNTHREDWPKETARASELELLRALQLPVAPEDVSLIGRSYLRTTKPPDPESAELREFAAGLGANYAIWSSRVVGRVETIEHEPVRAHRWRTAREWDADRNRYEDVRRWEPETVWVPVVVEREQTRWVVFYIRQGS